jgi:outer membrane protein TolC
MYNNKNIIKSESFVRFIQILSLLIIPIFLFSKSYTLEELIEAGMKNNHEKKISQLDIDIAQLLYEQVQSAIYPNADITIAGTRTDEDITFEIQDEIKIPTAMGSLPIPININTPVLGRDNIINSLNVNYTLYSGGKISALIEQAKLNKKINKHNSRQKDLDLIFKIKKLYQNYLLVDRLYKNTFNTYQQMKGTKELTKQII